MVNAFTSCRGYDEDVPSVLFIAFGCVHSQSWSLFVCHWPLSPLTPLIFQGTFFPYPSLSHIRTLLPSYFNNRLPDMCNAQIFFPHPLISPLSFLCIFSSFLRPSSFFCLPSFLSLDHNPFRQRKKRITEQSSKKEVDPWKLRLLNPLYQQHTICKAEQKKNKWRSITLSNCLLSAI